jgi:hypothetical protein
MLFITICLLAVQTFDLFYHIVLRKIRFVLQSKGMLPKAFVCLAKSDSVTNILTELIPSRHLTHPIHKPIQINISEYST